MSMHFLERVYGVTPSFESELLGPIDGRIPVQPSGQLIRQLGQFPAGTKIGIEWYDPSSIPPSDQPSRLSPQEFHGPRYWGDIYSVCQKAGLDVVFLDDYDRITMETAQALDISVKRLDLAAYTRGDLSLITYDPWVLDPALRRLLEANFAAESDYAHTRTTKKEDVIMRKTLETRPDIAMVDLAVADYSYIFGKWLQNGMVLCGYQRELVPIEYYMQSAMFKFEDALPAILDGSQPDYDIVGSRMVIDRSYASVHEGRVINDRPKRPQMIGSWHVLSRWEGLYEVYITGAVSGSPFSGVIEDRNGTADFEGELHPEDSVKFVKKYRRNQSVETSTAPITYTGSYLNGKYVGRYQDTEGMEGQFVLNDGDALAA